MPAHPDFIPLLLVLFLAFVVPLLLSRSRWVPVVVGEIIAGILVGKSGFRLISEDPVLDFLGEIGLAILMFLSGLEIDFGLLFKAAKKRPSRLSPMLISSLAFLATLGLAAYAGWYLFERGLTQDPWMLGLILSTTSLGVVVPVLREREMNTGLYGQTLLLTALLADFFTMFLITVYVAVRSRGVALDILVIAVLFVAALLVYRVGAARFRPLPAPDALFRGLSSSTSQVKVHAAIALLMAFVILAKTLGTEMILAAFLAGAVLSLLSQQREREIHERLDAIGFGFFIPLFFITVGIRFDLPSLLRNREAWVLTPLLLGAAVVIKLFSSLFLKILFSWRMTLAGGFLLSARLSLIIAAAGIGLRLGIIDESANAAFILIAALTSTLSPIGFNAVIPAKEAKKESPIVIFGPGDLGLQVAREIEAHGEKILFMNPERPTSTPVARLGFDVATAENIRKRMEAGGPGSIRSMMVLGAEDSQNLGVSREAVSWGIPFVIAMVNDPSRLNEFRSLGVRTFTPALYRAPLLALTALNPDLLSLLTSAREGHQLREIRLTNPEPAGKLLKDLHLGGDILILSIRRKGEFLVPHGFTRLEPDDILIMLGSLDSLRDMQIYLESRGF
jgi:Kef-type K+ transport system membrane component KefB/Trk K+ transport system NAD-binding subunit